MRYIVFIIILYHYHRIIIGQHFTQQRKPCVVLDKLLMLSLEQRNGQIKLFVRPRKKGFSSLWTYSTEGRLDTTFLHKD